MEVFGSILGWELNKIATGVSLRVRGIDSRGSVEWLMDVSDVVDEETDGVGEALLLSQGRELLHHGGVDEAVLVGAGV